MKYVIISAPSGAGKTTIVNHLILQDFKLEFSISASSRKMRRNETDGKDYYFMTAGKFREKIANNEFIEWQEVYKDHYYGTLKTELERIRKNGNNAIFDVDAAGGISLKRIFGTDALSVFIIPPSVEELEKRLKRRCADTYEIIALRMEKVKYELTFADRFDKIIINNNLSVALKEAEALLADFLFNL